MINGPFTDFKEFEAYCMSTEKAREPQIYAIVVNGRAVGMIAYMRVDPRNGAMEVGLRQLQHSVAECCHSFGFTHEGSFRQAIVYKGRNRDTTWFSIIDGDWNAGLKDAYQRWLQSSNFDENGQQKLKLSELTSPFVHARP
ncbi:hypothetical protein JG688_00013125 [Phytophthora aleatoria]|uniref:N-acetyltransferase domain-containing protein n=1 Tax=Phytophthora aleatoria TaxID=2496075 RepID=A0A8J5IMU6_9STRA|nr:hypothetical protein JG688_00013125 [Phytophthora aleatoria]